MSKSQEAWQNEDLHVGQIITMLDGSKYVVQAETPDKFELVKLSDCSDTEMVPSTSSQHIEEPSQEVIYDS